MSVSLIAKQIGMDYDLVLEDYCGDISLISSKLKTFVNDCDFPTLLTYKSENNEEKIKEGAHKIKKLSEKLGIIPLQTLAKETEEAKSGKLDIAFKALEQEFLKVEKILQDLA